LLLVQPVAPSPERGGASGEPWRPGLERGVEVKGATLTALVVKRDEKGWEARCVVDV